MQGVEVTTDESRDRPGHLFSVDDVVNRGPDSHLALDWLGSGRLLTVLGDHEPMVHHKTIDIRQAPR